MRILLTNNHISSHSGTELYLCEVAEMLKKNGHTPMCFSLTVGPLAKRLIDGGIPVSDDFRALPGPPDVIHGQHFIETSLAAMTYRTVPVISFCHGPEMWQESACQLPNVVHWVAVDFACRSRLIEEGINPDRLTTLLNHFDERRFSPRGPLPPKPRKALLVSNYLMLAHPAVQAISSACAARGIELAMVGQHLGGVVEKMEALFPQFDLVFCKARTAIEALAVGCCVVQVEHFGAGRMLRSDNFDDLRLLNFGYRSMTFPVTEEHLGSEIDRYDADDAARISKRIRQEATLENTTLQVELIYRKAIAQANSLRDYDPAIVAADFLRFQLYLSKMPAERIFKAPGVPFRLPRYPIPPGEIAECWQTIIAPHSGTSNPAVTAVAASRALAKSRKAEAIENLKARVAALTEENAQLKREAQ